MRKIVTKNTVRNGKAENGDIIEVVKFVKRKDYYSFVGEEYMYSEFTHEDIEDYITEFVQDVIDITYFENNPDTTYNDLKDNLCDVYNFVTDVLSDVVAYDMLDNGVGVWQMTGGGQLTTEHDLLNRVWNEYHLNKDLTATELKTINNTMDFISSKVEQKTVLGDLI